MSSLQAAGVTSEECKLSHVNPWNKNIQGSALLFFFPFCCSWNKFQIPCQHPHVSSLSEPFHLSTLVFSHSSPCYHLPTLVSKQPFQAFPLVYLIENMPSRLFFMAVSFSPFTSTLKCPFLRKMFLGCCIQTGFPVTFYF